MKSPEPQSKIETSVSDQECLSVLQRFNLEDIQHLGPDKLLAAQSLSGHGDLWGHWETPKSVSPGRMGRPLRNINLALRLRDYLAKEPLVASAPIDELIEEGVLALTRLSLLMRLIPSGGNGNSKTRRLKPSSIASYVYTHWPRITARAIRRKANDPMAVGLFRCLTEADLLELSATTETRVQVERLETFVMRGVWFDAPPLPDIRQTTDPSKKLGFLASQKKSEPYLPFPDDWLAEIGPRVLWIVEEMGPNLLRLLEDLREDMKAVNWSLSVGSRSKQIMQLVQAHLERHPWRDRAGKLLSPPFPLTTSRGRQGGNRLEWPPRGFDHVITLAVTLQAAHLFIALLGSGGRVGEVDTLVRECVVVGRDGKDYVRGYTYKLSGNLFGDARQWPAPAILSQCLGQQVRLAAAMDWLPERLENGLPQAPRFGTALWVSIGTSGKTGEDAQIVINNTLTKFAERLDVDPKPGGGNFHAHRFRKTVGRLAGVALFNSPLVLKRLFGHKAIETTLHYILCDPGVREEAEKVLRELRIMHCAEALEEIHEAMRKGHPLPSNGGHGAARLVTAIRKEEDHLNQSGWLWDEGSAYDLAYRFTAQGQGWRLVKENIVCSKLPGEDGLCLKKRSKGEPDTANCQPECGNRVVLARLRRDTELIVDQYLDIARQAREDGQILVLASVMNNLVEELENFTDMKQTYLADSEVQSLLALCAEPQANEATA